MDIANDGVAQIDHIHDGERHQFRYRVVVGKLVVVGSRRSG